MLVLLLYARDVDPRNSRYYIMGRSQSPPGQREMSFRNGFGFSMEAKERSHGPLHGDYEIGGGSSALGL